MERSEEFKKALKELWKAIGSTRLYKILITVMDWMEERLESLTDRMRGGQE